MEYIDSINNEVFLIRELAKRDKKRDTSSTNLGQFWQILNPFINMMILVMLFTTVFKMEDFVNFPLYICTGTILYDYFVQSTNGAMYSLVLNKPFLLHTNIKRQIFVMERIYLSIINVIISFGIYFIIMFFSNVPFRFINLLVIPDLVLFTFFVYGIGKILAVINVYFGDIDYIYSIITTFVFYGTAIFYSAENLNPTFKLLISWNPVYDAIAIARLSLIDGRFASAGLWLKLLMYSMTLYLIGSYVFNRGSEDIVAKI